MPIKACSGKPRPGFNFLNTNMTTSPERNKISYLIRLIDDRDEFVRIRVRDKLVEIGEDAIPFLEIAARTESPELKSKALQIIQLILPKQIQAQFGQLAGNSSKKYQDLEAGVILLAKFGYPDEDMDYISQVLDQLAAEALNQVKINEPPEQAIKSLTHFLFVEKGFEGNKTNFFDPDNTYFSRILKRRQGIPITLSTLCVFIGQRLGLPIVGVGLPGHFIAKYDSLTQPIYFDPFDKGKIISKKDCIKLSGKMGYNFEEHYLSASTNKETLARMMNNLIMIYNKNSQLEKADQLANFIKVLSHSRKNDSRFDPH